LFFSAIRDRPTVVQLLLLPSAFSVFEKTKTAKSVSSHEVLGAQ